MRLDDVSASSPDGMDRQSIISVIALSGDAKFVWSEVDPRLADKVDAYWLLHVETPSVDLRIVPDGRVDLIIDLETRKAFLAGPNEHPFDVRHERATRCSRRRCRPNSPPPRSASS